LSLQWKSEGVMDDESAWVMMTEMSWQVNEEVSQDVTGEADGMNQGIDFVDADARSRLANEHVGGLHHRHKCLHCRDSNLPQQLGFSCH